MSMNTELLRKDEREMYEWLNRDYRPLHKSDSYILIERLIEEREKNARLEAELLSARQSYVEEAGEHRRTLGELAEARTLLSNIRHLARNSDPQTWARDSHDIIVAVNAAIK